MALREINLSVKDTSKIIKVPAATVRSTVRRNQQRVNGQSNSRSGRPHKLSDREKRVILHIIRRHPTITFTVLAREAGVSIHKTTISRILNEEDISNWITKKRSLIIEEVINKRY